MKPLLLFIALGICLSSNSVLADRADDRQSGNSFEGLMVSASSQGFRFRINCRGPVRFFAWGSERLSTGATYEKTASCRFQKLGFTAGSATGGGCDNYYNAKVLQVIMRNSKGGGTFYVDRLKIKGKTIKLRLVSDRRWLTGPFDVVGKISSKEGLCLLDNGKFPGYSVPRGFRLK